MQKKRAFGSNSNFIKQNSYTCPSQHSYASNEVLVSDDLSITDKLTYHACSCTWTSYIHFTRQS